MEEKETELIVTKAVTSQYFINGDINGAITYMREHKEFRDVLPAYIAIFENCEYRTYDVSESLNQILRLYQIYYRDTWRETVPAVYRVELPSGTANYAVNILKGFIFRGWMDYLTFGRYGTDGWASSDGTINCIEQAYDFESERFLVSFLKYEAQHTVDMEQFPNIIPAELEYRAKLVELHYANDLCLLQKFLSEADENREGDSHAMASARIKREFSDTDQTQISRIWKLALKLFNLNTKQME